MRASILILDTFRLNIYFTVNSHQTFKWFFHICGNETNADGALAILSGIDEGRIQLVQPPDFISKVAAVLAREKPDDAQEDLRNLLDMDCQFSEESAIYASAVDLSIRLQHHLFDTLYHDEPNAYASGETYLPPELADRQYYQPVERGLEIKIREWLAYWCELGRKARHKL